DLAAELKHTLSQSETVTRSRHFPPNMDSSPAWWPSNWPPDAQCYELTDPYSELSSGTCAPHYE
ncbi:MAG: hypothetical protein ABGZ17_14160, partial [Planctomycetaceae bacterium]